MNKLFRIAIAIIIFVAVYFFTFWIPGSFVAVKYPLLPNIIAFIISSIVTYLYWSNSRNSNKTMGNYMLKGALITGSISFILGFVGPMIFMPESNLGPLLGLFFTGPIGFIVGLIGGGIYGNYKSGKSNQPKND